MTSKSQPVKKSTAHLVIGMATILGAIAIGISIIALLTYLSVQNNKRFAHVPRRLVSPSPLAIAKPSPSPTPTLSPSPTPTPQPIKPDAFIPPVENGLVPVVTNLPTDQPVVFLTIDDGAHKTPDELASLKQHHIKATLFLARLFISENPGFFANFQKAGHVIEDHTLNHDINMVNMPYEEQKAEICGMADYEQEHYGRRPILFRPPGGAYTTAMRQAAAACGMKALVTWIAKANGGSMQYQIGDHLRPGDIVLMHFRPEFQQDFHAFMDAMNSQHLHTALLEDWMNN